MSPPDPRVFFAAERTLLAWVRTAIAVMGLGFVVSKSGLLLALLSAERGAGESVSHPTSGALGAALAALGALLITVATIQHHRYVKTLPDQDLPARYSRRLTVLFAAAIALLGLLLTAYLLAV